LYLTKETGRRISPSSVVSHTGEGTKEGESPDGNRFKVHIYIVDAEIKEGT